MTTRKTHPSVLLSILLLAALPRPSTAQEAPPNIVVLLADDMGYSDLGCFGGEIETPNLDQLAADGLRFTDFYNTARCWPTRATILTGTYSDRIEEGRATLPQVLKTADYQTGMVGKWHLGTDPKTDGPIQKGFDSFYGTMGGAGSFWNPPLLARDTELISPEGEDYYYTDAITEEAVRQINQFSEAKEPFFQYVAYTAPHWPLHAPEETIDKYLDRYQGGWKELREERYARMIEMGIIDEDTWPLPPMEPGVPDWETVDHKPWRVRNMAIHAAMVEIMDQGIGKIVDALKSTGAYENTLIVFMSDNGACAEHLHDNAHGTATNVIAEAEEAGETIAVGDQYDVPMGGPLTFGSIGKNWANALNSPLRRYKSNVHEGGACTPAIVHWPAGMKQRGEITRQRGHVVDLMATCIELAEATYPAEHDGVATGPLDSLSLVPVLTGGEQPPEHPYYFNHAGTRALIRGDWKVMREADGAWKLYNLRNDRTETTDVSASHPELVNELTDLWEAKNSRQAAKR
ncbi:MAG: arylsulfatase [Chthoniobacterales bacterium]